LTCGASAAHCAMAMHSGMTPNESVSLAHGRLVGCDILLQVSRYKSVSLRASKPALTTHPHHSAHSVPTTAMCGAPFVLVPTSAPVLVQPWTVFVVPVVGTPSPVLPPQSPTVIVQVGQPSYVPVVCIPMFFRSRVG
jgi:hypothetical protein